MCFLHLWDSDTEEQRGELGQDRGMHTQQLKLAPGVALEGHERRGSQEVEKIQFWGEGGRGGLVPKGKELLQLGKERRLLTVSLGGGEWGV